MQTLVRLLRKHSEKRSGIKKCLLRKVQVAAQVVAETLMVAAPIRQLLELDLAAAGQPLPLGHVLWLLAKLELRSLQLLKDLIRTDLACLQREHLQLAAVAAAAEMWLQEVAEAETPVKSKVRWECSARN
jgi:hypothetical protein